MGAESFEPWGVIHRPVRGREPRKIAVRDDRLLATAAEVDSTAGSPPPTAGASRIVAAGVRFDASGPGDRPASQARAPCAACA